VKRDGFAGTRKARDNDETLNAHACCLWLSRVPDVGPSRSVCCLWRDDQSAFPCAASLADRVCRT
jgi:hypothetical protein